MLTSLVPVLFTFYIQGALKLKKKNNSGAKGLRAELHYRVSQLKTISNEYAVKYNAKMTAQAKLDEGARILNHIPQYEPKEH
jgi:hypothetical protein